MAPRRVVIAFEFAASFRGLKCPHARWMVQELAVRLVMHPHCAPLLDGDEYRVLHTKEHDRFPALRLFYCFDDAAVYLLDVELYDPLLPEEQQ